MRRCSSTAGGPLGVSINHAKGVYARGGAEATPLALPELLDVLVARLGGKARRAPASIGSSCKMLPTDTSEKPKVANAAHPSAHRRQRQRPNASRCSIVQVTIAGVDPTIELMPVQALFNRQLTEHVFDCCEFPLTSYIRTLESPTKPYLAVPVFPSRHFRLSCVFVHAGSGITEPADLAGKRVGIPVFDMAAAVWLRGIFEDHYGLDRTAPIYVSGGLEEARRGDEHPQYYPAKFHVEHVDDHSLAELLELGAIDALYTARAPSTWPSANVKRLFADPVAAEFDYFGKTGIFPPMHVVALKRPLAERHPDLAAQRVRSLRGRPNDRAGKARRFRSARNDVAMAARASAIHRTKARPRLLAGRLCEE